MVIGKSLNVGCVAESEPDDLKTPKNTGSSSNKNPIFDPNYQIPHEIYNH